MHKFWEDATDKNKTFAALLTDLSNTFDCLCHDLLIAKLHTYGLDIYSVNLLQDYLSNRKQRTKIESFLSSWENIWSGVPKGPVLSPLSFNISGRDASLILKTVYLTDYAIDNTPFAVANNIKDVIWSLEEVGENLITWFSSNHMRLNPDKWVKVFKNGPNKICGRQPLKNLKCTSNFLKAVFHKFNLIHSWILWP